MGTRRATIALVAVALVAASCGGGTTTSTPSLPTIRLEASTAVLAASVDRTVDLGSYNFEMIAEVGVPGFDIAVTIRADGSVDAVANRAAINVDMSDMFDAIADEPGAELAAGLLGEGVFRWVVTPEAAYLDLGSFGGVLGVDTGWVKMPIDAGMLPTDGFGLGDPNQILGDLDAAGDVVEVGPDTVRGLPVTHFQVKLDTSAFAAAGASAMVEMFGTDLPLDVYIDAQGVIRRVQGSFSGGGATGGFAMELFDFGAGERITVPSDDDVTTFDPAAFLS